MYQNYTKIRIYVSKLAPYKLPKYVPMRIFSLEYIGQMINMDEIHFVSSKKNSQFKLKAKVGTFICNTRFASTEVEKLLKSMNLQLSFTWSYDPFGIILALRVQLKATPYNHTPRLELEKFINQEQWSEGTLLEADEQVIITPRENTPVTQSTQHKIAREETQSAT